MIRVYLQLNEVVGGVALGQIDGVCVGVDAKLSLVTGEPLAIVR